MSASKPRAPFTTPGGKNGPVIATADIRNLDMSAISMNEQPDLLNESKDGLRNLNISMSSVKAGGRKKRAKAKSVSAVRQPDKEGVERFHDPAYNSKLDDIQERIREMMQERIDQGKEPIIAERMGLEPAELPEPRKLRVWHK